MTSHTWAGICSRTPKKWGPFFATNHPKKETNLDAHCLGTLLHLEKNPSYLKCSLLLAQFLCKSPKKMMGPITRPIVLSQAFFFSGRPRAVWHFCLCQKRWQQKSTHLCVRARARACVRACVRVLTQRRFPLRHVWIYFGVRHSTPRLKENKFPELNWLRLVEHI